VNGPDPTGVLDLVLDRLDRGHHPAFILGSDEQLVPAVSMIDHDWLAEQLRLRGLRWGTDDARVLATLWWYSASAWMICPTLASLALGGQVLSADCDDLAVHWLPDSRITGATSSRVLASGTSPLEAAADSLRGLFEHVITAVTTLAGIGPRPLWAIAADSIATRVASIGRATGELELVTGLLHPLCEAIGSSLPMPGYVGAGPALETRRLSCCLLYLAPGQSKCSSCPKLIRRHPPRGSAPVGS